MIVSDTIRLFDEEDFSEDYPTSKVLEAVAYTFGIDPVRLRAIAEAERDGRLAILPCKVGTKVFSVCKSVAFGYPDPIIDICIIEKEFHLENYVSFGISLFLTREEAEVKKAEVERNLAAALAASAGKGE